MKNHTRPLFLIFNLAAFSVLTACGGGGGDTPAGPEADTTPPVIESTTPNSGAITSNNISLVITFNEDVKRPESTNIDIFPYTVDSLDLSKRIPLKSSNPISVSGKTLTIRPMVNGQKGLQINTKYHVYLHGVTDTSDNAMSDCRWEFATTDYAASVAKSDKPCNTPKPGTVIDAVAFAKPSSTVPESGPTITTPSKAIITVNRNDTSSAVSVDYNAVISSTAPIGQADTSDVNGATSGKLTFVKGDSSEDITILITDDSVPEPDETFTVELSNATGIELGSSSVHTVTIQANDNSPTTSANGKIGFTSTTKEIAETALNIPISITRIQGSTGPVEATYTTSDGTGKAGINYTTTTGTVKFADGVTTVADIVIPIINDNAANGNKDFIITLSNPTGGATLATTTIKVTILDAGASSGGVTPSRALTTAELVAIWSLLL